MTEPIVVCATDFSDSARHASEVAAELAARIGGSVHLVRVVDGPAEGGGGVLQEEARRLASQHAIRVEATLLKGRPEVVVPQLAERLGAILVVVGATGEVRSMFRVGGVTERIIVATGRPVLVVRDPAPLIGWSRGEPLAVAALVTDDAASARALGWVRFLRAHGTCDVALLHAYYVDQITARHGLAPRPLTVTDPEITAIVARDLARLVGEIDGGGQVSYHPVLAVGRLADHLAADPAFASAKLVVIGNHRHRGLSRLSSVAAGILHLSEASAVLVVPPESPAVGLEPWPRLRRLVVPIDFSPFSAVAIRHAYGLLDGRGGSVHLFHAMTGAPAEASRQSVCARLEAMVPTGVPGEVSTFTEALWHGDPADAVIEFAEQVGADGIVLSSHGSGGVKRAVLGSVSDAVVRRSRRPVLIVRPPYDT